MLCVKLQCTPSHQVVVECDDSIRGSQVLEQSPVIVAFADAVRLSQECVGACREGSNDLIIGRNEIIILAVILAAFWFVAALD
jgi:hypothetical protein